MRTDIQFLHELRDDLMQAAERRTPERVAIARPVPRAGRTWKVIAGVAAGLIGLSAIVGYVVTRPSDGNVVATTSGQKARDQILGPLFPPGPQPGALPAPRHPDGGLQYRIHRGATPNLRGQRTIPPVGPSIIKTARVYLRIPKDTFKARFDEATRIAEAYDGYVQSSSTSGARLRSGGLLIRIPAANFERALTDLRGLGRVEHQSVQGRDVSAEFVDLDARLRNARAEERVLLKLLAKAPTVEASLHVQNELSNTELQIEELEGQIRFLQHRAGLSTIDAELSERSPKHEEPPGHQTFGGAWRDAIDGFFGVATTVVVGLGYVIPVALLLAAAWLVFRRVRNRALA